MAYLNYEYLTKHNIDIKKNYCRFGLSYKRNISDIFGVLAI